MELGVGFNGKLSRDHRFLDEIGRIFRYWAYTVS